MICYIIHQTWTSTVSDRDCAFSNRQELLKQGFEKAFHLSYNDLHFINGPHGKPMVTDYTGVYFNLTHTYRRNYPGIGKTTTGADLLSTEEARQYFMAGGFADHELGIDCEYPRPVSRQLMERALSPEEKALVRDSNDPETLFLRLWTLKESYLKYTGEGLSQNPASITFLPDQDHGFVLHGHPEVQFKQFDLADGLILSLCTAGDDEVHFISI